MAESFMEWIAITNSANAHSLARDVKSVDILSGSCETLLSERSLYHGERGGGETRRQLIILLFASITVQLEPYHFCAIAE